MADLTERLQLTQGTNRIIEDPVPFSPVKDILGFLSGTMNDFIKVKEQSAANRAQATKEAKAQETQTATLDAIRAPDAAVQDVIANKQQRAAGAADLSQLSANLLDTVQTPLHLDSVNPTTGKIFADPAPTVNPVVEKSAASAGREIQSITAAVEQGRMPAISLQAAMTGRFNSLINKHPADAEQILDVWKKMGIDETLFRPGRDLADNLNENRESGQRQAEDERKTRQQLKEEGIATYGDLSAGMKDDDLIAAGMRNRQHARQMAELKDQASLAGQAASLSEGAKKAGQETTDLAIFNSVTGQVGENAAPLITMAQQMAASMNSDKGGVSAERFQQLGVAAHSKVLQLADSAVRVAQAHGYTGDAEKIRTQVINSYKPMEDFFSGDFSVQKAAHAALQTLQDKTGLTTAEAFPLYTALKGVGLDVNNMPAVAAGIAGNPGIQKRLQEEVRGYKAEFGSEAASTHILDIVKIMRGEATLSQMSPSAARERIPTLYGVSKEAATRYARGLGGDADSFVHAAGEVTTATRTLVASSGATANVTAATAIGLPVIREALKKAANDPSADKPMVLATVSAHRAGAATILDNVRGHLGAINKDETYFEIKWDDKNGKYFIDDSKKKAALAATATDPKYGAYGGNAKVAIGQAQPSQQMTRWLQAGNISLDTIVDLGTVDPSSPAGSPLELRRHYGNNQPLKSQKNEEAPINTPAERNKIFDNFEKSIEKLHVDVPTMAEQAKSNAPKTDFTKAPQYKEIAPLVKAAAAKYGVPEQLALALIGKESSFNPNKPGHVIASGTHAGDRAMGLGQVMAKTAAAYGVSDRSKLGPAEQADLAMRILSDNKKRGGDWKDAVSRYFTGVDYAKAKSQNRSDGFNSVIQYVEDIT